MQAARPDRPPGLLIGIVVNPGRRPGPGRAALLLKDARADRRLARVWADQGYSGPWRHWAARELGVTVEVVAQHPHQRNSRLGIRPGSCCGTGFSLH